MSTRPSNFIKARMVERYICAGPHAFVINRHFNRFATLHVDPVNFHSQVTQLFKLYGDWLEQTSHYLYVFESRNGRVHAHCLLHVPDTHARRFAELWPSWLSQVGIKAMSKRERRCDRVHHSQGGPDDPVLYLNKGLKGLLRYIFKGCDPAHAARFEIRPSDQGLIPGKRCGSSESLSPKLLRYPTINVRVDDLTVTIAGPESRRRRLLELCWYDEENDRTYLPLPARPDD